MSGIELTKEQKKALVQLLKEITNQCELGAIAVVSDDGSEIAFFAEASIDRTLMSALASAIASTGGMSVRQTGYGELVEVIVKGTEGYIVLSDARDYIIIGASKETHSLGLTTNVLRRYAQKVSEILGAPVRPSW